MCNMESLFGCDACGMNCFGMGMGGFEQLEILRVESILELDLHSVSGEAIIPLTVLMEGLFTEEGKMRALLLLVVASQENLRQNWSTEVLEINESIDIKLDFKKKSSEKTLQIIVTLHLQGLTANGRIIYLEVTPSARKGNPYRDKLLSLSLPPKRKGRPETAGASASIMTIEMGLVSISSFYVEKRPAVRAFFLDYGRFFRRTI